MVYRSVEIETGFDLLRKPWGNMPCETQSVWDSGSKVVAQRGEVRINGEMELQSPQDAKLVVVCRRGNAQAQ